MSERQIELVWGCSSCRHRNLGRHTICQQCGNPKDDSEEYEMPADPAAVASVTDPALLRLATAGANWSCTYCASDQRALDGSCARCGAGRPGASPSADASDPRIALAARRRRMLPYAVLTGILLTSVVTVLAFAISGRARGSSDAPVQVLQLPPRTDFTASITSVTWTRTIAVETRRLVPHEDFTSNVPAGAVEVRAAGQHVHHEEEVFDHNETVYDDVEVPDGYRTEAYSERVSCGQDCKTTPRTCKKVCSGSPRSCKQKCTNNKNGFASCREECTGSGETCRDDCSGGNTSCTTKYCDESRTRQVPKTRTEKRARTVPRYRREPRHAAWSTFKVAEWVKTGGGELTGDDLAPRWPDAGVSERDGGPSEPPKLGETRVVRSETCSVMLRTDDGATHHFTPPSLEDLAPLAPGSTHQVRIIDERVTFLDEK